MNQQFSQQKQFRKLIKPFSKTHFFSVHGDRQYFTLATYMLEPYLTAVKWKKLQTWLETRYLQNPVTCDFAEVLAAWEVGARLFVQEQGFHPGSEVFVTNRRDTVKPIGDRLQLVDGGCREIGFENVLGMPGKAIWVEAGKYVQ